MTTEHPRIALATAANGAVPPQMPHPRPAPALNSTSRSALASSPSHVALATALASCGSVTAELLPCRPHHPHEASPPRSRRIPTVRGAAGRRATIRATQNLAVSVGYDAALVMMKETQPPPWNGMHGGGVMNGAADAPRHRRPPPAPPGTAASFSALPRTDTPPVAPRLPSPPSSPRSPFSAPSTHGAYGVVVPLEDVYVSARTSEAPLLAIMRPP